MVVGSGVGDERLEYKPDWTWMAGTGPCNQNVSLVPPDCPDVKVLDPTRLNCIMCGLSEC